jgi:release factor glutamine methyltransferase
MPFLLPISVCYLLLGVFTFYAAFCSLREALQPLYDVREAAAIAHEWLQHITGLTKFERLVDKHTQLTPEQQAAYEVGLARLVGGTPLQYVTGKAWFMGKEYLVNHHVLIPRPETEELVQWIVNENQVLDQALRALDIGTGSGCIATMLQLLLPQAAITGIDISEEALEMAIANAQKHFAAARFHQLDFLNAYHQSTLGTYHIIASNPPYIPIDMKSTLHKNVLDFEPHLALFTPAQDPLVFYRAIAVFGQSHLAADGAIYCELDAANAEATKAVFESSGYQTVLRKDMYDNWRMIKAWK